MVVVVTIYKPSRRIAIASSFEGIVNDGAPECALVSFNAYHEMDPSAFFFRKLAAAEFNASYRASNPVRAFLALRPIVEVAEDYLTVLEVIRRYPTDAGRLADDPSGVETYLVLADKFRELKEDAHHQRLRGQFGKGKTSLFYIEREALKQADHEGWLGAQAPFEDTLPQLRLLVDTQVWDGDRPVRGFYPRFATSKDEASTQELCNFYVTVGMLDPTDVGGGRCIIPPNGIIGMETVPSRDKVEQLNVIAQRLDVPRSQVWRMNDRCDPQQQKQLADAGFVHQFFLPGYATPHEIDLARNDPRVRVLERKRFAEQLGAYAEQTTA